MVTPTSVFLNFMRGQTDMVYIFDIANSHGGIGEQTVSHIEIVLTAFL